jgi:hypothetical protein
MAYNIKDVFYLDTSADVTASTSGSGTAQLDLSAYIDPIARGRTKGTGLAIYKVHFMIGEDGPGPIDDAEAGTLRAAMLAGAGFGDTATGAGPGLTGATISASNNLLVAAFDFYGPKSMIANASTTPTMYNNLIAPSTEVPYVVVRDNVCLAYDVGANFTTDHELSVRLECAQITLDQATLNQLLRTQTV